MELLRYSPDAVVRQVLTDAAGLYLTEVENMRDEGADLSADAMRARLVNMRLMYEIPPETDRELALEDAIVDLIVTLCSTDGDRSSYGGNVYFAQDGLDGLAWNTAMFCVADCGCAGAWDAQHCTFDPGCSKCNAYPLV